MKDKTKKNEIERKKFGTLGGVFTPSLLTILGVIMFLRFSTVVGYAGLWYALLILAAGKSISLITGLSVASIATNMRVKGGGAYYLISRSLGVEFGGVIAIFFFVAQAVAVTLYVVGFSEAIFNAFPNLGLFFKTFATLTNFAVFVCVYIGAGWTIRIQYGIFGILMLSILSFFIGAAPKFSLEILSTNLYPQWSSKFTFFTVFAIFFPAVTGIMAGVNMSGDLDDPARSIPKGTFAAIGFSGIIYLTLIVLFATTVPRAELLGEGFIIKEYALSPVLVYAGVFCATLSSSLGSMMGAPRILQAFARDNIFKRLRWFGHGSGPSAEPRRAILLTFLIAQIGVLAGDLDTIAPVITMFFLMTYATVNLACFYEGRSRNPSFRPTFRLNHWSVALLGALGCTGVMFMINVLWASVALALGGVFFFFITRSEIQVKWGDLYGGLAFQTARNGLLRLERERYHPKNWRPSILALTGGVYNRLHLTEYACWFTLDSGIVSLGQIIKGDLKELHTRRQQAEATLRQFILKEELPAFPVVVVEDDLHTAVKALLQCHGIGGMRPNTVLLGWSEDLEKAEIFWKMIATVKSMKRSLIIISTAEKDEKAHIPEGVINIWWDSAKNVELMLLLAFMLKKNRAWRDQPIRVIRPVTCKADMNNIEGEISEMLAKGRIEADILVIPTEDPFEAVRKNIHPSAILFRGFEPENNEETINFMLDIQRMAEQPGDVILVYDAGDVSMEA